MATLKPGSEPRRPRLNPPTRRPHLYSRTKGFLLTRSDFWELAERREATSGSLLKAEESTHIDEIVERLESELSSSEIFAALFELELTGKIGQMPGMNFVKSF